MKRMILLRTLVVVAFVAAVTIPSAAFSDVIELKVSGHNITCTQNSAGTLTCTGELSGLGSGDVTVVLDATRVCSKQNQPPGLTRLRTANDFQVKNGKASFRLTLGPGCPDGFTTTWSDASISAYQNGQLVFGPQPVTITQQ
jgi:hypothetical protein